MIETPRKRTFGSIHSSSSPNSSSTRQRDQDNPWFRDPSQQDKKEYKARKNEHTSSPRSRPSHHRVRSPPPSGGDRSNQQSHDEKERVPTNGSRPSDENRDSTIRGLKEPGPAKKSTPVPSDDTVEDGEIAEGAPSSNHSPSPSRRSQSVKSDRDRHRDRARESDRERLRDLDRPSIRHRQHDSDRDRPRDRPRERRVDSREREYVRDSHRERERRKDRDRDHGRFAPPPPSYSDHHRRSPDRDRDHPRRRFAQEERSSRHHREDYHRRNSERRSTDSTQLTGDHLRRPSTSHNHSTKQDDNDEDKVDDNDEATGVAEPTPQLTEDEILEQARRKRAEILAKHKQLCQTVNPSDVFTMTTDPSLRVVHNPPTDPPKSSTSSATSNPIPTKANHLPLLLDPTSKVADLNSPAARMRLGSDTPQPTRIGSEQSSDSAAGSPEPVAETNFDLTQDPNNQVSTTTIDDEESVAANHPLDQQTITGVGHQSISAADYNPDDDRRIDNERQNEKHVNGHRLGEQPPPPDTQPGGNLSEREGANGMDVDENGDDDGGDDDDDDDMFAIDSTEKKAKKKKATNGNNPKNPLNPSAPFLPVINRAGTDAEVVDNFDDADGYYRVILGELLDNGRYHVHANLGKGMFASVVRAKDMSSAKDGIQGSGSDVAIKVVRSQESMFKSSQKEAGILKKLQEADPAGKYHIIRLERTFEHRGHLCLVFEAMSMNLREVVKRFGKDVGINLRAVRAYAHQMFLALSLMKKCNIMHADLKPDNILVSETKSVLKVCDLGSASDVTENEITPYLVSRFYRAPEIILGLPYDCSIDIWSIGCTLYELYTGKILFPGRSNNHLLLLIMELKGRFNSKLLKKAKFSNVHFDDENGNFLSVEKNRITGTDIVKSINIPNKPTQGLQSRLMPNHVTKKMQDADVKLLSAFVDLLEKILTLEPSRRISPKEALNHPFIRGI
ncbi:U4/U6 small nuclear ribonucleoprotein prp4 [Puccinia graminis f. sp. tritici]|uniref:non-specific serine/threonine protein kinase n=1 Tax=Puccinia graminis f. sp. tritici TaxID=56615 RepID=A0A5B0MN42_PUCGR|nr:U4/U6 small nuclear ribonucleoprotein prp4 [Puccinia graminis f. sp. tritici]